MWRVYAAERASTPGRTLPAQRHIRCSSLNSKQTHSQAASIFIYKDRPDGTVKKGRPCSITVRRVPELIPVLGSQPAGVVSHKPDGRLLLLSITLATLKRATNNFAAW